LTVNAITASSDPNAPTTLFTLGTVKWGYECWYNSTNGVTGELWMVATSGGPSMGIELVGQQTAQDSTSLGSSYLLGEESGYGAINAADVTAAAGGHYKSLMVNPAIVTVFASPHSVQTGTAYVYVNSTSNTSSTPSCDFEGSVTPSS
jgi:hypothetical protein